MSVAPNRWQQIAGQPAKQASVAPQLLPRTSLVNPFTANQHLSFKTSRTCAQRHFATKLQCQQKSSDEPKAPTRRRLLTGLLAGNAMVLAASCPCCRQVAEAAEGGGGFAYAGYAGPQNWPGTCTVGQFQSPINIPLAEHLVQRLNSSNQKAEKIGDISFEFEQTLADGGEIKFNFEQDIEASKDIEFHFEKKSIQGGRIKFQYQQHFDQQMDRHGTIKFQYNNQTNATVKNTGHGTMQVDAPKGNMIQIGDRNLELVQWHFHTPSEHAFDGERKAMEVHLVHKDTQSGGFSVIGVLLEEGRAEPNPAVQFALKLAPDAAGQSQPAEQQPMQLNSLLPRRMSNGHRPYVHYVGSLTTPPCSEEVQWYLFADTVTLPGSQVDQFQQFCDKANPGLRANSRPLQPLNGRSIDYVEFM